MLASLERVVSGHRRCAEALVPFFRKMWRIDTSGNDPRVEEAGLQGISYIQALLDGLAHITAMSSWAPDLERPWSGLTAIILNFIVGIGNWLDAFDDHPVKRGEGNIYDDTKFTHVQRFNALVTIALYVRNLQETLLAIGFLDVNTAAFKHSGTTAAQFLVDCGWKEFFSFLAFGFDIVVYIYQEHEGWWPSIIFLHKPPCWAVNTDFKEEVNQWNVASWRKRAAELYLMFLVTTMLREEDKTDFAIDTDFSNLSIFNLLMAHEIYIHWVVHLHIGRMYAALIFKNLLVPIDVNFFDGEYNSLRIESNTEVVARYQRERIANAARRLTDITIDMTWRQTLVNILGHCTSVAELPAHVAEAVGVLVEQETRFANALVPFYSTGRVNQDYIALPVGDWVRELLTREYDRYKLAREEAKVKLMLQQLEDLAKDQTNLVGGKLFFKNCTDRSLLDRLRRIRNNEGSFAEERRAAISDAGFGHLVNKQAFQKVVDEAEAVHDQEQMAQGQGARAMVEAAAAGRQEIGEEDFPEMPEGFGFD